MLALVTGASAPSKPAEFGEGRGYMLNSPERTAAGASPLLAIRWVLSHSHALKLMQEIQFSSQPIFTPVDGLALALVEEADSLGDSALARYLRAIILEQADRSIITSPASEPSEPAL
jgi:hypothetical protein